MTNSITLKIDEDEDGMDGNMTFDRPDPFELVLDGLYISHSGVKEKEIEEIIIEMT